MKTIEVDEDLYRFIASHTQHIGESASDILRRMLKFSFEQASSSSEATTVTPTKMAVETAHSQNYVRMMELLIASDAYRDQQKVVDRFMQILSALCSANPGGFQAAAESLHGRTRRYFAVDEHTLSRNGSHTKPKQILGTPWWVITNTNTERKRSMVKHIMLSMHLPAELAERVCVTL